MTKKILWCGSTEGGLGWLFERTQQRCQGNIQLLPWVPYEKPDASEQLMTMAANDVHRIILACKNRWDYPQQTIGWLQRMLPEVPVALAGSDWWVGWRRTGIGHFGLMPIVCLPWFRWWDGWSPWLSGDCTTMLGPFPSSVPILQPFTFHDSPQELPSSDSVNQPSSVRNVRCLVVGGCIEAIQTWQQLLRTNDPELFCQKATLSEESLLSVLRMTNGSDLLAPDWILWDDSRLSTALGREASWKQARSELSDLSRLFPGSRLWVAWTLPSWEIVQSLWEAGLHFELLAKPYFGSFSSAALGRT